MPKHDLNPIEFNVTVGAVIRSQRKKAGLEPGQVALAVGAKVEQIFRYEAGTNKLSVMRLFELANVFGVPPSALILEIETRTLEGSKPGRANSSG